MHFSVGIGNARRQFGTDGAVTEVMRIDSNVAVGIGINAPSGKLDVQNGANRAIKFEVDGTSGDNHIKSYQGNGENVRNLRITGQEIAIDTNSSGESQGVNRIKVLTNGNVGIGTDLPAQQLHVQPAADNGGILVSNTKSNRFISCTASDEDTGYRFGYSKTAGGLIQRCDGKGDYISNTMVFTDSNDVGIGTTTPAEKLHVNGKVRANDYDLEALPPLP